MDNERNHQQHYSIEKYLQRMENYQTREGSVLDTQPLTIARVNLSPNDYLVPLRNHHVNSNIERHQLVTNQHVCSNNIRYHPYERTTMAPSSHDSCDDNEYAKLNSRMVPYHHTILPITADDYSTSVVTNAHSSSSIQRNILENNIRNVSNQDESQSGHQQGYQLQNSQQRVNIIMEPHVQIEHHFDTTIFNTPAVARKQKQASFHLSPTTALVQTQYSREDTL